MTITILKTKNISSDVIETIDLSDDIEIPSDNELVTHAPKKIKKTNIISTHPNRTHLESRRILRKYHRQRQKGNLKKLNEKASKWSKKACYLGTDDLETINYNNDTPMDDLETVDFNNDTEMSDLIDLKKEDIEFVKQVPLHPRKRLKRKRKAELNNYSELSKNKFLSIQEID